MSVVFPNEHSQLIVFFQSPLLIGVRMPVAEATQGKCKSKTFVRKKQMIEESSEEDA